MKRADLEKSVSYQSVARDMENPGKIYYKAPYIFVNEKYKGIHVINNSDPRNPVREGFIVAPGCIDMAVKGNVMYLDNSVDLVAFDWSIKQVTKRIKNVFPEPISPDNMTFYNQSNNSGEYILVGWKKNPEKK
jgi:glutaredoxin